MLKKSSLLILFAMILGSLSSVSFAAKGRIELTSTPGDAKVYINGKRKGTTPSEVGQSFVIELKEGDYTVEVVLPSAGQFEQYAEKELFVAEDTMQPISLKLTQRPSTNFRKDLKRKHPEPLEVEMVLIQGGSFQMGCISGAKDCVGNEKPVHGVTLDTFLMGKYEVTFDEWDACVATGGCNHYPVDEGALRGKRAVNNVSWNDAQQYIKWLNKETGKQYRLPTEAEWEYAARAGTETVYSWGSSKEVADDYAWYYQDAYNTGKKYAHKVGAKKANPWGLYDMHGNVWEWTQDWYDKKAYSNSIKSNPVGPSLGRYRVNRGGGWSTSAGGLRSAFRVNRSPTDRYGNLGFRLVRNP